MGPFGPSGCFQFVPSRITLKKDLGAAACGPSCSPGLLQWAGQVGCEAAPALVRQDVLPALGTAEPTSDPHRAGLQFTHQPQALLRPRSFPACLAAIATANLRRPPRTSVAEAPNSQPLPYPQHGNERRAQSALVPSFLV